MRFLFVALFMVLASHVGAQEAQGVAGEAPRIEEEGQWQAEPGNGKPGFFPLGITIFETTEQAERAREREAGSDKHEADDLAAQQKAADAADRSAAAGEGQVKIAWWQIGFAAVGTGLLFTAFLYTKWTYDHGVLSSERQLRAYVCLNGVITPTGFSGDEITTVAEVKNFGLTPASELSQWTLIKLREYPLVGDLDPYGDDGHPNRLVLPPGALTLSMPTFRALEAWEITAIKDEQLALYVYGEVAYKDAFGEQRWTKFRMRSTGEQAFKLGVFKAAKDGNSYT